MDQPLRHARSPSFLNSTEFPILQQAAHLRLKVALPKLPADLKIFVTEAGETVLHPVLAVPSGIVMHDWNAREVPLEQDDRDQGQVGLRFEPTALYPSH